MSYVVSSDTHLESETGGGSAAERRPQLQRLVAAAIVAPVKKKVVSSNLIDSPLNHLPLWLQQLSQRLADLHSGTWGAWRFIRDLGCLW